MKIIDIKNLDQKILPTKKHEQYRSFDISKLFEQEFEFNNKEKIDLKEYKKLENKKFYNIYALDDGLDLNGLDELFEIQTKKEFESVNSLFKLNSFINPIQTKLIVKKLDKPLNIINIFTKTKSFYAQNLHLVLEDDTNIIETFYSKETLDSFININREYEVKETKKVEVTKLQLLQNSSLIMNYKTTLKKDASLKLTNLEYKAKLALNIFDSVLSNENTSLEIEGVLKLKENQKAGNIAYIEHLEKNTKSDIKFKHLLDERSHALFDISSKVQNSALYAKAFQNSQTVLISDDAKINANPRLEIYVDELEASHGASCGSLNEDELYYLTSRGISKSKAKEMIIDSIELQVINNISNLEIKTYIEKLKRREHV